jgi:hypothetical protein
VIIDNSNVVCADTRIEPYETIKISLPTDRIIFMNNGGNMMKEEYLDVVKDKRQVST